MESHWLNRMAAKLAHKSSNSPKIHVELFFPDNKAGSDFLKKIKCL